MAERKIPKLGLDADQLVPVTLEVELEPIDKDSLPVQWIQVLPFGTVKIADSRADFEVGKLAALNVLAHFEDVETDLALDYNHSMYYGEEDAKAAGWGERMRAVLPAEMASSLSSYFGETERTEILSSDEEDEWGIYLLVRWNEEAAVKIRSREYRYVSPVIFFAYSGEPNYLWNVAITNTPAISNIKALAARKAGTGKAGNLTILLDEEQEKTLFGRIREALHGILNDGNFSPEPSAETGDPDSTGEERVVEPGESPEKGDAMSLDTFARKLGLDPESEDFKQESVEEALAKLVTDNETLAATVAAQATAEAALTAARDEAVESVKTLESALAEVNATVETLTEQNKLRTVDDAIVAGQITPAMRDWALENWDAFSALLPTLEDGDSLSKVPVKDPVKKETGDSPNALGDDRAALAARISAYAKENNVTPGQAYIAISAEDES